MSGETENTLIAYGGEIKALENGHFGGYLVRFTDATSPDLTGDYFTADTDFGFETEAKTPIYLNHRQPLRTKGGKTITIKHKIGEGTMRKDTKGILMDAIVFSRDEFEKDVVAAGKGDLLGWSSGTASHMVDRELVGKSFHIKSWPLGLDASLTPTPAEPRNAVVSLKSLGLNTEAPAENGSTVSPGRSESLPVVNLSKGLTEMDAKEMQDFWDKREAEREAKATQQAKALADRDQAVKDAVAKERLIWEAEAKALRQGGGYMTGPSDDPLTAGQTLALYQQYQTTPDFRRREAYWKSTKETRAEAKAFIAAAKGDDAALSEFKASNATDMNIGTPGDGGYAVPTGHYQGVIAKSDESRLSGPLGVMAIPGVGTTVNVPIDNGTANEFVVTSETSDEDQDAPVLNQVQMTYAVYTKGVTMSYELMRDEDSRLMAFLDNYVGRAHARTHNSLLVTALAAGATAYNLASASAIAAAEIPGIIYTLKDQYADSAKILTKRSTEGAIRALSGNFWQFMPTPPGGGTGLPTTNSTLWNFPIYHSTYVTAPAANAKSLYYGDFSYVGLREDQNLFFLRDPYSLAKKRQVVLHYYFSAIYKVLIAEALLYMLHPSA